MTKQRHRVGEPLPVHAAIVAACLNWAACATPESKPGLGAVLDSVRAEAAAPGAILAVRFPDGRMISAASGVAHMDSSRLLVDREAFFLGSISKTYTAVIALRLAEQGLMDLDDRLDGHLAEIPRAGEVTVRQLLDHTSGLKDFYSYLYFRPDREEMIELVTKDWTRPELLDLAGRFGYWFDPGSDWSYSNTNYFLLGVVIEQLTGRRLAEAIRTHIASPLALEHTWLTWHEAPPLPLSITGHMGAVEGWPHSEMFGELGPTSVLDRSPVEWGAGGLAATAEDAVAFLDALFAGRLLSAASLAEMTRFRPTPALGTAEPAGLPPDRSDGYGLGLVRMERPGFTLLGHGGVFTGHTAGLWHLPTCGVTVAIYFNRGFVNQRAALDRILPVVDRLAEGAACAS